MYRLNGTPHRQTVDVSVFGVLENPRTQQGKGHGPPKKIRLDIFHFGKGREGRRAYRDDEISRRQTVDARVFRGVDSSRRRQESGHEAARKNISVVNCPG